MNGHQSHRRSHGIDGSRWVGEHCSQRRRQTGRSAGAAGKENVGISNEMRVRPRTPNPEQRQTDQGKSGPNEHPRGESDGQTVNIPLLAMQGETRPRSDTAAHRRNSGLNAVGSNSESGQYRESTDERIAQVIKLARKASDRVAHGDPYCKPTQVGKERILRWTRESWLRN